MNYDQLEDKIRSIKKRGLNIMVENELIADARKTYHEERMRKKLETMADLIRRNNNFLGKLHGEYCSAQKIKSFMGLETSGNLNKALYENGIFYNLHSIYAVAEFYGIPMELLMYTDLEANEDIIKREYPAIIRQGRN
jgi:hypothetical protein